VLRFPREDLDRVIEDVNTTGYGLTFGLHTRIDETIARVVNRIEVGNVYVNRNMVGAVVGVQPFGGSGMSGTGPKAGGPFYLGRLSGGTVPGLPSGIRPAAASLAPARLYAEWLQEHGRGQEAERVLGYLSRSSVGAEIELPGTQRRVLATVALGRPAPAGPWTLVVDAEQRPQGWLAAGDRIEGAAVTDEHLVPGGSLYDVTTGSLRSALDAALSSPSGQGVAVDAEGRVVGSISADDVLAALASARAAAA